MIDPVVAPYDDEPRGQSAGAAKAPRIHSSTLTVSDGLPREVVTRIANQKRERLRMVYGRALAKNPKLDGRVVVRFTIGGDGSVLEASDCSSSLPDALTHDVVRSFVSLAFPTPAHGPVIVTIQLDFAPPQDE